MQPSQQPPASEWFPSSSSSRSNSHSRNSSGSNIPAGDQPDQFDQFDQLNQFDHLNQFDQFGQFNQIDQSNQFDQFGQVDQFNQFDQFGQYNQPYDQSPSLAPHADQPPLAADSGAGALVPGTTTPTFFDPGFPWSEAEQADTRAGAATATDALFAAGPSVTAPTPPPPPPPPNPPHQHQHQHHHHKRCEHHRRHNCQKRQREVRQQRETFLWGQYPQVRKQPYQVAQLRLPQDEPPVPLYVDSVEALQRQLDLQSGAAGHAVAEADDAEDAPPQSGLALTPSFDDFLAAVAPVQTFEEFLAELNSPSSAQTVDDSPAAVTPTQTFDDLPPAIAQDCPGLDDEELELLNILNGELSKP